MFRAESGIDKKRCENAVSRILSFAWGKELLPSQARGDYLSGKRIATLLVQPTRIKRAAAFKSKTFQPCAQAREQRANAFLSRREKKRRSSFLFGFAPCGACRAIHVTINAVSSYLAVSPLPAPVRNHGDKQRFSGATAVCFLWRFPSARRRDRYARKRGFPKRVRA